MSGKANLPTGSRMIYINRELSQMIGLLPIDDNGRFSGIGDRIIELCRLGCLREKQTFFIKKSADQKKERDGTENVSS